MGRLDKHDILFLAAMGALVLGMLIGFVVGKREGEVLKQEHAALEARLAEKQAALDFSRTMLEGCQDLAKQPNFLACKQACGEVDMDAICIDTHLMDALNSFMKEWKSRGKPANFPAACVAAGGCEKVDRIP